MKHRRRPSPEQIRAAHALFATQRPEPAPLAYLRKLDHGHAGSGRSDRLFSLARFLRHGMQCTESEALGIMHAWNAGNVPPFDDAKVLTTWENADTYNARPRSPKRRRGERHAA